MSRPRPSGRLGGPPRGCVSRSMPKEKLGSLAGGRGLGSYPGGKLGVWPGGGSPGPGLGIGGVCIPACTEAATLPKQTATAADGTLPTGMHSCFYVDIVKVVRMLDILLSSNIDSCGLHFL